MPRPIIPIGYHHPLRSELARGLAAAGFECGARARLLWVPKTLPDAWLAWDAAVSRLPSISRS